MQYWKILLLLLLSLPASYFAFSSLGYQSDKNLQEWPSYGGDSANTHFSSLKQINRDNVAQLQVAWTYDTKDSFEGSEMQCNPIIVNGVMYATSPKMRVFALDAATGQEKWSFDPNAIERVPGRDRNRGVTYWEGNGEPRVYFGFRNWLYAVDVLTPRCQSSLSQENLQDQISGNLIK